MQEKKKIVILGAGPAGLAAAWKLCEKHDVTVLEKKDQVAGLAMTFAREGKTIPRYYHHIMESDETTRKYFDLAAETKDLRWQRIRVGICVNGKIYGFTDPVSLLKFNYLSLWGKFRYGLFGFYVLFVMNPWKIGVDINAETWLLKYAGREVTDKIFYHLYARNKFNIPLGEISARQFANRLKAKEAVGVFGFPRNGLHTLFEGMERHINERGSVLKEVSLAKVNLDSKTVACTDKSGKEHLIDYDILINRLPVPELLKVQKGLPGDYAERIGRIRYCPVVSVAFATKEYLSGHYWLNVLNERVQIIMQHSILNDDFGYKVSWVSRYGGSEEDLPLDDDRVLELYLADVKKFFPDAEVLWARVFRELYASPIYDRHYMENMPDYTTPVKDFFFAGIAATYPRIRSINTALRSGEEVAELIASRY